MINHVVITSNLNMYRFTKEPKRLLNGIVDEFCLIFNSIKAVSRHETEFRFRFAGANSDSGSDSHLDSHSFNFELLFTILNFKLNNTITFCLD